MNYEEIVKAWNDRADASNSWEALGEDEKIEFAVFLTSSESDGLIDKPLAWVIKQRDELLAVLNILVNSAEDVTDAELKEALESDDKDVRDQANAFMVARAAVAKMNER